jgi:hypothetical protein
MRLLASGAEEASLQRLLGGPSETLSITLASKLRGESGPWGLICPGESEHARPSLRSEHVLACLGSSGRKVRAPRTVFDDTRPIRIRT